jgi:hypothetical protein
MAYTQQSDKEYPLLTPIFFWSPSVVLRQTFCSIGPKYIFHTGGPFLHEFGYHTVFKNILESAI